MIFRLHIIALITFILIGTSVHAMMPSSKSKANVNALYSIELSGIEVGEINYKVQASEEKYTLSASMHISVLASLFKWKVEAVTMGKSTEGGAIKPEFFEYKTEGRKNQHVNVAFPRAEQNKFVIKPSLKSYKNRVPVKPEHLQKTFDPMTAIAVLTQLSKTPSRNICNQQVPVFDGKSRYDIKLSFKKPVIIDLDKKGRRSAYICKMTYHPISGHKQDTRMREFLAKAPDIEVWLLPIPKAKMYALYQMTIPTPLGTAYIKKNKLLIEKPQKVKLQF